MIYPLYQKLLKSDFTRSSARKTRATLLKLLKVKDAYTDLTKLCELGNATLLLDIGCHKGHTIQRSIESGISVPIHGFDPIRENLANAATRLKAYPQVSLHEIALSDRNGETVFHINRNEQTSSLLENDSGNLETFAEQVETTEDRRVPTETLDHWLERHQLENERIVVKSDIQGAEELLVRGASKAFSKSILCFYGEVMLAPMYKGQTSLEQLNAILEKSDMILHNLYPCMLDPNGRAVQCDALWIRRDLLQRFIKSLP